MKLDDKVFDINGIEIKPGMRAARLIKSRGNAKDIEGIVQVNQYKDHGLSILVEKCYYPDGREMKDAGGYHHGIKKRNNYLVIDTCGK